jgi:hypothetical protein
MAHTWHTDYVNMITSDDCQEWFNMEIWKSIQGYEGLYKISSYGNIKGSKFNKNLKPADNSTGYKFVNLSKEGILKKYYIHRLVACNFISNTYNKSQVNHKDGNKGNNNVDNLEWLSASENVKYSYDKLNRRKFYFGKSGAEHSKSKKVGQYDLNSNLIKEYFSVTEANKVTNICMTTIVNCCNKKYNHKTAGGYIWKYI